MVFSVPQQTYNERGVEGLPQSMSRIHTTWYQPSNSGAANQQAPGFSTWQNSLPPEQQTAALAKKTAELWMSSKTNLMQLPSQLKAADASGDGVIDQEEFKTLMEQVGGGGDSQKIFAEVTDLPKPALAFHAECDRNSSVADILIRLNRLTPMATACLQRRKSKSSPRATGTSSRHKTEWGAQRRRGAAANASSGGQRTLRLR